MLTDQKDKSDLYKWYLLQHKPNKQNTALENLKRQGLETFYPLFENTKRTNSRFKNSFLPIFPGYIFVFFNIKNSSWIKIKYTIGVSRIVGFNSIPSEVPLDIILALQQKYNRSRKLLSSKNIKEGDNIKILKGPLSGFVGKIEEYDSISRIKILLEFMGNPKSISINVQNTDLIYGDQ